ncbi:MAG: lamin tail domain-containing protein [Chloroflexi bacterium]|nr:lamin tail domain-containing protein [Chloroflexota bacterium]
MRFVLGATFLALVVLIVVTSGAVNADETDVKINEFVSDTGTMHPEEWIELYNAGSDDVNLAGFTIEDGTNNPVELAGQTISAGEYLVLMKGPDFGFGLNNSGDVIILKSNGLEIDRVAYGNWDDGNSANNAPRPGKDESAGRCPDGLDTNADDVNLYVFGAPSPGNSNACQGSSTGGGTTDSGADTVDSSSGTIPGMTGWSAGIAILAFSTLAIFLLKRKRTVLGE